jgi:hypothetical protein
MERGDKADVGSNELEVGGDHTRLDSDAEQQDVEYLLVLEGDLGLGRRQCDYDVELATGNNSDGRTAIHRARALPDIWGKPVATGVVSMADEPIGAGLGMAVQRRRSTPLDGDHPPHPPLEATRMPSTCSG